MTRGFTLLVALAMFAGCQTQNPLAAFGPATIDAPRSAQAPPYYPPTTLTGDKTSSPSSGATSTAATPRLNVSAETVALSVPQKTTAQQADQEPIRIVENPTAAAKTASASQRDIRPSNTSAPGTHSATPTTVPPNNLPASSINTKQSGLSPTRPPIGLSRTRGYAVSTPPVVAGAKNSSRIIKTSHEEEAPTFVETAAAEGTWRSR
jgi:hypothetical protein